MNIKAHRKSNKNPTGSITPLLYFFPLSIFFGELMVRLFTYGGLSFKQFMYILLFSVSTGGIISAIAALIKNRTVLRVYIITISFLLSLVLASQVVYFQIFGNFYSWESAGMAGEAMTQFYDQLFDGIVSSLLPIILIFLPSIALAVFNKGITFYRTKEIPFTTPLAMCAIASFAYMVSGFMISANTGFEGDLYFFNHPNSRETYLNYGVLTSSRLELEKIIFGEKEMGDYNEGDGAVTIFNPFEDLTTNQGAQDTTQGSEDGTDGGSSSQTPPPPVEYGYNVLDIDFESLIANAPNSTIKDMHQYFSSLTPTKQNEYTGYFEGKNLIFLTLEGFSGHVIDPLLTPTLYMMANEGFVFNNFYCSCWGGSTSTGEYANLTGNFYNSTACMTNYSGTNHMPLTLGNQFIKQGYNTFAFHGHTYSYYKRQNSHPNLGYQTYLGIGNGLEKLTDAQGNTIKSAWPRSDLEVAKVSIGQFINKTPFHVYYMTISGHANYNFLGGNKQCSKHKADVAHLPYSEEVRAYIACQLEVELALREMVEQLEEAGILDDTVFVMAADHYPYGLSSASLAELYKLPETNIYKNFDLYRNSLIIWSSSMEEPITVDTPCSAIDILPTVSNLFGLEYDSRLMGGTDIFSDVEPIVILNCDRNGTSWNWITKYGEYNSSKGFTLNEGYEIDKSSLNAYVKSVNAVVKSKKNYIFKVLTQDYYKYVLPNG